MKRSDNSQAVMKALFVKRTNRAFNFAAWALWNLFLALRVGLACLFLAAGNGLASFERCGAEKAIAPELLSPDIAVEGDRPHWLVAITERHRQLEARRECTVRRGRSAVTQ